jgi:hypothetical protein
MNLLNSSIGLFAEADQSTLTRIAPRMTSADSRRSACVETYAARMTEFRASPPPDLPGIPSAEGTLPGPDQLVGRPRALTMDLLGELHGPLFYADFNGGARSSTRARWSSLPNCATRAASPRI